ncbi:MAG: ATP-binding protein [Bacteroidota bacterium]
MFNRLIFALKEMTGMDKQQATPQGSQALPIRKTILAGFSLAILAVAIMGYYAFSNVQELADSMREVTKPDEKVTLLSQILDKLSQADGMTQSFVLTGNAKDIDGYTWIHQEIEKKLLGLDSIQVPDPVQAGRMKQVRPLIREKQINEFKTILAIADTATAGDMMKRLTRVLDFSAEEIGKIAVKSPEQDSLLKAEGFYAFMAQDGDMRETINDLNQEGVNQMQQIRHWIERLESYEKAQRTTASQDAQTLSNWTAAFVAIFGIVVLILLGAFLANIFNHLARNRRLQNSLKEEKARAEKLARAKEDFLANMSHEIRTPMNAVIGFSEQLSQTRLNQQQNALLSPIRDSAHYLLALLNDILDYSKIESGNFKMEAIGFHLSTIMGEVQTIFAQQARHKGIGLSCESTDHLPSVLVGDPLRLRQMLFNLVSNALKFTKEGEVKVSALAEAENEQEIRVAITVEDTGIGIDQEKIDGIFSKFIQADSSTTRQYGGTGLGLSITRELARLHGGDIRIESEVGKGTQATLSLLFKKGTMADLETQNGVAELQHNHLAGKTVLLADDEAYNRALVCTILEKWEMKVDSVENGKLALEKLEAQAYDIVLLDVQMPEMDGITLARTVRKELSMEVPIIALTATSTQKEIEAALAGGMNEHLLKPFREEVLHALLMRYLAPEAVEQTPPVSTPEPTPVLETATPMEKAYNLDALKRMGQQNPGFVQNMVKLFIQNTTQHLEDLEKALPVQDWDTVSMTAHKMIPPTRHLGMKGLVSQLKEIELGTKDGPVDEGMAEQVSGVMKEMRTVMGLMKKELKIG